MDAFIPLRGIAQGFIATMYGAIALRLGLMALTGYGVANHATDFHNPQHWVFALATVILGTLRGVAGLICIILLCKWMYRAYKNLSFFGTEGLRGKPKDTVWAWFIPFACLVLPYQYMREIWRASDPRSSATNWKEASVPKELGWWWGLYLGAAMLPLLQPLLFGTAGAVQTTAAVALGTNVLAIVSAIISIRIVSSVTDRQEHKSHLMSVNQDSP